MSAQGRFAVILATALLIAGCEKTEADKALRDGYQAFRHKAFREALQYFRVAAARAPSNVDAHTWRGHAAEVIGELDEALEAYRTAFRLEPSADHSYRLGALAERIGETPLAVESLKANLSFSRLQRLLSSLKTGFSGFISCVMGSLEVGVPHTIGCVLQSVIGSFSDLLRYRPNEVAQYLFRVLVEAGDRNEALQLARSRGWLRQGIDYCSRPSSVRIAHETSALLAMLLHPERADCLYSTGRELTNDGLVRLARLVLLDRMRNSPDQQVREKAEVFLRYRLPAKDVKKRAEALNIAGYNLQRRHRKPQEAIEVYQKAIAADPSFSWPYSNIGQVYENQGENVNALEWYKKAVAVNPNHWRAQRNLGWVLLELKRYEQALIPYRRAVALNSEDHYSQYKVAWLLMTLRRYEESLVAYRQAVALKPNDAYSHWGLSWVLAKLGKKEESIEEWHTALRLDPNLAKER